MTREQAQSLIQSEPKAWEVIDEIYNDFEEQLANLNSNLEAQEIMIADYKKRIAELEHQAKNDDDVIKHLSRKNHRLLVDINQLQAPKSCDGCMYYSVDIWNDFVCLHTIPCSRSCDDYYRKRINND